jgi:hypothetical protein
MMIAAVCSAASRSSFAKTRFHEFLVKQQGALQDFESFLEAAHRPESSATEG